MTLQTLLLSLAVLGAGQKTPDLRCGGYCLYVSLKALEAPVGSYEEFERRLGSPSAEGYSLGQLQQAAQQFGMQTLAVQTNVKNLGRRPGRFACIAHINGNHFVNLARIEDGRVWIIDPPRQYHVPIDTLRTQWNGTALLVSAAPLLAEEDLPREWPWKTFIWIVAIALAAAGGTHLLRARRSGGRRTIS